ncbi:MAG: family N-acetyltransferase [Armatimonadetes bacterium]|jgi:ribosomal protein S18 acetylase RimI-like enzyme|nr:family N-acetyltransferase [Armatimonadota bacterium]
MQTIHRLQPGEERLWSRAVATVLADEGAETALASEAELSAALADARCYLFVAESGAEPVGLLSAYRFPDVVSGGTLVYLYDIEVQLEHRGQGVGKALIRALMEYCRQDDVKLVWAGTDVANTAARRAFAGTGATLEGESYAEYEWEL